MILDVQELMRNRGEQLTTVYGCTDLRLPVGERVISRENNLPYQAGWLRQRIVTDKRVIQVDYQYGEGKLNVYEFMIREDI